MFSCEKPGEASELQHAMTQQMNDRVNECAHRITEMHTANTIIVTKEEFALSNQMISLDHVAPCRHEEADMRIFVHARDAVTEGHKDLMIKANDTDILVIAISTLPSLQELGLEKLWIAFGKETHLRWIPTNDIVSTIDPEKTSGILFLHAISGCDVVSAFHGKGKRSAWQTWSVCNEVSSVFKQLNKYPPTLKNDDFEILEKFVIIIYDWSSTATCVNDA